MFVVFTPLCCSANNAPSFCSLLYTSCISIFSTRKLLYICSQNARFSNSNEALIFSVFFSMNLCLDTLNVGLWISWLEKVARLTVYFLRYFCCELSVLSYREQLNPENTTVVLGCYPIFLREASSWFIIFAKINSRNREVSMSKDGPHRSNIVRTVNLLQRISRKRLFIPFFG